MFSSRTFLTGCVKSHETICWKESHDAGFEIRVLIFWHSESLNESHIFQKRTNKSKTLNTHLVGSALVNIACTITSEGPTLSWLIDYLLCVIGCETGMKTTQSWHVVLSVSNNFILSASSCTSCCSQTDIVQLVTKCLRWVLTIFIVLRSRRVIHFIRVEYWLQCWAHMCISFYEYLLFWILLLLFLLCSVLCVFCAIIFLLCES